MCLKHRYLYLGDHKRPNNMKNEPLTTFYRVCAASEAMLPQKCAPWSHVCLTTFQFWLILLATLLISIYHAASVSKPTYCEVKLIRNPHRSNLKNKVRSNIKAKKIFCFNLVQNWNFLTSWILYVWSEMHKY